MKQSVLLSLTFPYNCGMGGLIRAVADGSAWTKLCTTSKCCFSEASDCEGSASASDDATAVWRIQKTKEQRNDKSGIKYRDNPNIAEATQQKKHIDGERNKCNSKKYRIPTSSCNTW
jgi:hypothetical protein